MCHDHRYGVRGGATLSIEHEDLVSEMVRDALSELGRPEADFLLAKEQSDSPNIVVSIRTPRGIRSFVVGAAEIDVDFALDRSGLERLISARVAGLYR